MFKIIELEIDPSLSGETGVFEVAWVEFPAIEQDMMVFSKQSFFKAPENVSEYACRAIRENEERGNPAGTQVGKVRAQQLCQKQDISLETVKRMKSFLERAETYNSGDWDDNGTIAYGLWGGPDALTWVNKILSQEEDFQDEGLEGACWEGYEPIGMKEKDGRMVPNCVPIENKKQDFAFEKVSFEYDDILNTTEGLNAFKREIGFGNYVYIVSNAPFVTPAMRKLMNEYRVPQDRIFATGSDVAKVRKIKDLGIVRHYDSSPLVKLTLPRQTVLFDIDVSNLPEYASYPESGTTGSMLVSP